MHNEGGCMKLTKIMYLGLLQLLAIQSVAWARCTIDLYNSSGSIIWVTQDDLGSNSSEAELQKSQAVAIDPYNSQAITLDNTFAIYTRAPKSNRRYQRNYTVVIKQCNDQTIPLSLTEIDEETVDAKQILVIDHTQLYVAPEGYYPLCPDGTQAQWDKKSEQWYCPIKQMRDMDGDGILDEVEEYVPVYSYIYQWLPSWVISEWYVQNPMYYNWFDKHQDYWQHLHNYQPIWQTNYYKKIYPDLTAQQKWLLKNPTEQATVEQKIIAVGQPVTVPATKIEIKSTSNSQQTLDNYLMFERTSEPRKKSVTLPAIAPVDV